MKKFLAAMLTCALLSASSISTASAAYLADLSADNWAYDYVNTIVDKGIMYTDDDGNFYPDVSTTRGYFVMALWNACENPYDEVMEETSFPDVPSSNAYHYAVEWAVNNGITSGISRTQFGPDMNLTREQAFTFLYRTMDYLGVAPDYSQEDIYSRQIAEFTDYGDISSWAADPMQLLMDIGIVTGSDNDELWPKADVSNAATATIICRAIDSDYWPKG